MKKQETRGGSRPNSGRKPKPYKTKVVTFRVREEWVDVIKKTVKDKINKLNKK